MQVNLRTLGPNEAQVVLLLRLKNQDVVQASEIIGILGSEFEGPQGNPEPGEKGMAVTVASGPVYVSAARTWSGESGREQCVGAGICSH